MHDEHEGRELGERWPMFATQLRALRRSKGMTQWELSSLTGLSRQAINKLEGGRHSCSLRTFRLLVHALKLDLAAEAYLTECVDQDIWVQRERQRDADLPEAAPEAEPEAEPEPVDCDGDEA